MAHEKPYTDEAMKNHQKTYAGFLLFLKWGIILITLVLLGMAIFLA